MKPIKFPEQNIVWAEDQPEYQPLPAFTDAQHTVSLWALTWRERFKIFWTGRLWLTQLNYRSALQPQLPSIDTPFTPGRVDDRVEAQP